MIAKVLFRDSVTEEMLQPADMVCGAIGTLIDDDDRIWYDQIAMRDLRSISLL